MYHKVQINAEVNSSVDGTAVDSANNRSDRMEKHDQALAFPNGIQSVPPESSSDQQSMDVDDISHGEIGKLPMSSHDHMRYLQGASSREQCKLSEP